MKPTIFRFLLVACSIWLIHDVQAQLQAYRLTGDSFIKVTGTSTLHDWEMRSENVVSEARFNMNDEGDPENLESLIFRLNKTTLKSNKSGLDRRAYDALKAGRYPEIVFRTNGSSSMQDNGDNYNFIVKGELTFAGITREISVNAICLNGDDNKMVCSGSQKLKMTDFQVDPPVLMLGALRTGDEVTINYRMVYNR